MTEKAKGGLPAVLDKMEGEISKALGGGGISSERFIRAAKSALNGNPAIAKLERNSILASIMAAAQDGLVIDGKEAAIVPMKGKATYIPMVQGMMKKMRQHSEYSGMSTGIIYLKEVEQGRFTFIKGDKESLTHDPILFDERGEAIGAYAIISNKDGEKFRVVLRKEEIEKRLGVGHNSSAKQQWREEFWIKTVIKAVYKIAPKQSDQEGYLDSMFGEEAPQMADVTPVPTPAPEPKDDTTTTIDGDVVDADGVVINEADKAPKRTKAAEAMLKNAKVVDAEIIPPEEDEGDENIPI